MGYVKLGGGILAAIAAAYIAWVVHDHARLAALDNVHRACVAAVKVDTGDLTKCDPAIAAPVQAARQAAACEAALGAKPLNLYTIRAVCGEQVKRVEADRDVQVANLADANAQLATAATDRDGAVLRAEARATSNATRKAANDQTIQSAPRTADGRVHCDAECLRKLAGG